MKANSHYLMIILLLSTMQISKGLTFEPIPAIENSTMTSTNNLMFNELHCVVGKITKLWSFFSSEKPYEIITWDIPNVGTEKINDCVPTTLAEANNYFGLNTSYEEYKASTNYQDNAGVLAKKSEYQTFLSEQYNMSRLGAAALADPRIVREMQSKGYLISTNMPHGSIRHADNLRSISYYSDKVVLHYRNRSYRLDSINDKWWFYLLIPNFSLFYVSSEGKTK